MIAPTTHLEEIHKCPQRRAHLAAAGIVDEEAVEGRAPVFQHADQPAIGKRRAHIILEDKGEPGAVDRRLGDQMVLVEDQRPLSGEFDLFAILFEFPAVENAAGKTEADAAVIGKLARMLRSGHLAK